MDCEYNHVTIAGRLTAEPVLRRTRSGQAASNFYLTLYHHRSTGDVGTSSFQVTAFGELAGRCAGLCVGQAVLVEGRLREDRWMGPDDRRRSKVVIVADRVHLMRTSGEAHIAEANMTPPQHGANFVDAVGCAAA